MVAFEAHRSYIMSTNEVAVAMCGGVAEVISTHWSRRLGTHNIPHISYIFILLLEIKKPPAVIIRIITFVFFNLLRFEKSPLTSIPGRDVAPFSRTLAHE